MARHPPLEVVFSNYAGLRFKTELQCRKVQIIWFKALRTYEKITSYTWKRTPYESAFFFSFCIYCFCLTPAWVCCVEVKNANKEHQKKNGKFVVSRFLQCWKWESRINGVRQRKYASFRTFKTVVLKNRGAQGVHEFLSAFIKKCHVKIQ